LCTFASHQPEASDGKGLDALSTLYRHNTSAAISECRFKLTSLAVKVKRWTAEFRRGIGKAYKRLPYERPRLNLSTKKIYPSGNMRKLLWKTSMSAHIDLVMALLSRVTVDQDT